MNDLLQAYTFLANGLRHDPQTCLATAVTWLDPLWKEVQEWEDDEGSELEFALRVVRELFPELYVDAADALRQGAPYSHLDDLICKGISRHGIPLDNLEWMMFGIPIPAYGASLDDPDFYRDHPDTIPVLECFGIVQQSNVYQIDVPDCAYSAGVTIAADLAKQEDAHLRQVSWLMRWLFSCSGNSGVDYDYEIMGEIPPLPWDKDDLVFATELIEEANVIIADAFAGLTFLNSQPDLLEVLRHNVRCVYKAIRRQKGKREAPKVKLNWSVMP